MIFSGIFWKSAAKGHGLYRRFLEKRR
ncbi:hypothetical protein F383_33347 [Gossypium arboreum]|uniref:Uncharacterized protein n=1 Tax=Gossypium arboreum TaxID=29729 RepID=A0A0B0PNL2_GOSAR|nr:hypothetical protein F383_33347 [Gossypium arboreum]